MKARQKPDLAPGREEKFTAYVDQLTLSNISYDDLLNYAAHEMARCDEYEKSIRKLERGLTELAKGNNELSKNSDELEKAVTLVMELQKISSESLKAEIPRFAKDAIEIGAKLSEKNRMQKMSRQRHVETYLLRAEVIEHWKNKISPGLSAEKAGTLLEGHFPISHRKLVEYVAAEKKILLARKA